MVISFQIHSIKNYYNKETKNENLDVELNGSNVYGLSEEGYQVTSEIQLGNNDRYSAPSHLLEKIAEITKVKGKFDLVIIQNNMDAGHPKALVVD